jgi:type IV secretory pathway TraG/TraD family ATPase VirD4
MREGLMLAPDLNRECIELFFGQKSVNRDVLSTIGNRTLDIRDAAVEWSKAQDSFTFGDWKEGRFALVHGYSHNHPTLTQALSRVVAAYVSRTILADKNTNTPRTYCLWDELPFFGKIDSLQGLLSLGRKKGLAAAIAYQKAGQMLEVYGPHLTRAINGLTPQRLHCRTSDAEEAEAISRHFGETQRSYFTRSVSRTSGQPGSESFTQHIDRIRVVTPEAIMGLPVPMSDDDVIWAYVISPVLGLNYACPLPLAALRRILPPEVDDDILDDDEGAAPCGAALIGPPPTPPPLMCGEALPAPTTDSDEDSLPYLTP